MGKQYQVNIHFNEKQYKALLERTIKKKKSSISILIKDDVIEIYKLPDNGVSPFQKLTPEEQLKKLVESQ